MTGMFTITTGDIQMFSVSLLYNDSLFLVHAAQSQMKQSLKKTRSCWLTKIQVSFQCLSFNLIVKPEDTQQSKAEQS